jgi:molybdopterin/thiamine biosynthesis adenylyltransferase
MNNKDLTNRYSKQILMPEIGEKGQERLSKSSVLIAGCGALGTVIANSIVRAGAGFVRIIDRDFIEYNNLPRQVLFDEEDIKKGLPKAVAAAEKLRLINSDIKIEPVVADLTSENIEHLMKGMDIVIDGTDNFETRFLINDACVKLGVPWVYGGVVSTSGMSYAIIPGKTPCFKCFISKVPPPGSTPTCDTVGVLGMAVNIVASIEVVEAIKILIGDFDALIKKLIVVDPWYGTWKLIDLKKSDTRCSVCDDRQFEFLEQKRGTRTTSLCGQNSVQIIPPKADRISFEDLAGRLKSVGNATYNKYMLKLKVDQYEFTIFPDGRAIVKGTNDESAAKTLLSKYIGM